VASDSVSYRLEFEALGRAVMSKSRLGAFIRTARSIAGRDATSPFSLEDVYSVASELGLAGVLFLEKSDENRHVTVLLSLDERDALVYDPLSGVKVRPCNELQLGMYARPVGLLREEFQVYAQQFTLEECSDVWVRYVQKGQLLLRFLRKHTVFRFICSADVLGVAGRADLPALQDQSRPSDCAPTSLFVMSLIQPPTTESSMSAWKRQWSA